MDKMDEKVSRTIEKFGLLQRGNSVLVALSGGPDSVALLCLLIRLKDKYGIKLAAAHLDHAIRKESSEDRDFCRKLCQKLGIEFHSKRIDVRKSAAESKASLEEAGRNARYAYLNLLADRFDYDCIATGHTADDNVETVIFNLARGTGLAGLGGIPPKRDRIIRPLIEIRKKEILRWLKAKNIGYRIDKTNRSLKYARNRIRSKIVPQLEMLNKSVSENIARSAAIISDAIRLIDSIVEKTFEKCLINSGKSKIVLDLAKIRDYDNLLKGKLVIEAYRRLGNVTYRPSSEIISRSIRIIDGRSGGRSPLGQGIWIEKSKNSVSIFKAESRRGKKRLEIPGITRIPSTELFLQSEVLERDKVRRLKTGPDRALLDLDTIVDGTIRFWKNGDRIRPFGMRGRRLLSDIFTDRGIPSSERGRIPLLTSKGKIAWIAGVMISDDFKIEPGTKKILSVRLCGRS